MFCIEPGNHIFVSVLIIYLRMTLTLFANEAFPTVPITWVTPAYFGQPDCQQKAFDVPFLQV